MGLFDKLKNNPQEVVAQASTFIQQHSNPVNPPKEERETFANDSGGRDEGGGGNPINPVGTIGKGGTAFKTGTVSTANNNAGSGSGVSENVADAMRQQQEAVTRKQQEAIEQAQQKQAEEQARQQEQAQRQAELARQRAIEEASQSVPTSQVDANISAIQEQLDIAKNNNSAEDILRLTEDLLQAQRQRDELNAQARAVASKGTATSPLVGTPQAVDNGNAQPATVGVNNPLANNFANNLRPDGTRSSAFVKNAGRAVREEDEDEFWTGGNPLREEIDRVNSGNLRATDQTYGRPVNGASQPNTSVYDVNPTLRFSGGNPNPQPGITRDQFLEATSNLFNPIANIGVRPAEGSFPYHPNVVPVGTTQPTTTPEPQTTTLYDLENGTVDTNYNPAVDFQTPSNPTLANDPMAYWLSREYPAYTGSGDWNPNNKNPDWSPSNQIPRNAPEVPVVTETPANNSQPSGYSQFIESPVGDLLTNTIIRSNLPTFLYDQANALFNGQKDNADRLANFFKPQEFVGKLVGKELGKLDNGGVSGLGAEQVADYDTAYRNGSVNPAEAWNSRAYPEYTGDRTSPDFYNGRELMSSTQPQPRSTTGTAPSATNPNPVNTRPYTGTPQVNQPTNDLALEASIRRGETTYEQVYNDYVNQNVEPLTQRYLNMTLKDKDGKEYHPYTTEAEARQAAIDTARRNAYNKIYDLGFRSDYSDADIAKYGVPSLLDNINALEKSTGNNYYTNDATYPARQFNMVAGGTDRSYDQDRLFYDLTSELAGNAYANATRGTNYNTTPNILNPNDVSNPLNLNGALQAGRSGALTPDQILHFYDANYTNLNVPESTQKWLASDSTHALQELVINNGKNIPRLEKEHGSEEEFNKAMQDFLNANPELKLLRNEGVVDVADIANYFFKGRIDEEGNVGNPFASNGEATGKTLYLEPSHGQSGTVVKAPYRKGGYSEAELMAMGNNPYKDRNGYDAYEGYYRAPDGQWYPVDQEKANYYNRYGTYRGWDEGMRDYYNTFGTFSGYTPNWRSTGKKSSGGGRSYYRGGNYYSNNRSYSNSPSVSSNYQPYNYSNSAYTPQYANQQRAGVSPTTSTQRSNRIYNIMKNWSF